MQNQTTMTTVITLLLLSIGFCGRAQTGKIDTLAANVGKLPGDLAAKIGGKAAGIDRQLTSQTADYMGRLSKQEDRLKKALSRFDTTAVKDLFPAAIGQRYKGLEQKLQTATGSSFGSYMPYADSLKGALSFLGKNPQLASLSGKPSTADIQKSLAQLQQLQGKLQGAGQLQQLIAQRQQQIGDYLSRYTHLPSGITGAYNGYKEQAYYYSQQVKAYRDMLDNPDKLLKATLAVLGKQPAFQNFMKRNSALAGLFGNGGGMPGDTSAAAKGPQQGLPSRDKVMASVQAQAGTDPAGATALVQGGTAAIQGQADQLKNKLAALGGSGTLDMPDFKPNGQKTKGFLHRLELGTNLQSAHGSLYFPATTDIGLSLGYKLDDKDRIGVGASYKIGWGNSFSDVNVTNQGVGLRSFADIHLKKNFYASGGFEYNYQQPFASLRTVGYLSGWQKSGLLGISQIIPIKSGMFKNTKVQLLWDFLSYGQVPVAQPFKFRVGFGL